MNKGLKIAGAAVGGLAATVLLVGCGAYLYAGSAAQARLDRTWPDVQGKDIPIPWPLSEAELDELRAAKRSEAGGEDGAAPTAAPEAAAEGVEEADPLEGVDLGALAMERAVARGSKLVMGRTACTECHGEHGAGKLVVDAQPVWTWYAPNITKGGKTKDYTGADWDRIIRHGVKKDGSTATMPSVDFYGLSDREVSDIAAYFSSQPALAEPQPVTALGPVGKFLVGFGVMPLSAELIDHSRVNPALPPEEAVTIEFGEHIVRTCAGCHRLDYRGGPIAQGPPEWPPAANLTELGKDYTEAQFFKLMREGISRSGEPVREPMSMMMKAQLTDDELKAMHLYLQTLEPLPTGE